MLSQNEAEYAFHLHTKIVENEKKRRELFLDTIPYLVELHDKELYTAILGDEKAPWSGYLGQIETFYSRSKVNILIAIYNKFVKELSVTLESIIDIPHSKLNQLIKISTKENVQEWLDKARALTNKDFEDELRIISGKESYLDCNHSFEQYEVCKSCGFRHKQEENEKNM